MKLARTIAVLAIIALVVGICSGLVHETISAGEFVWSIVLIVAFASFLIER